MYLELENRDRYVQKRHRECTSNWKSEIGTYRKDVGNVPRIGNQGSRTYRKDMGNVPRIGNQGSGTYRRYKESTSNWKTKFLAGSNR